MDKDLNDVCYSFNSCSNYNDMIDKSIPVTGPLFSHLQKYPTAL